MEFEKINRVGEVDKTEGHSHFRLILKYFLLLCAPYTSGFFYIKTNFFNKRSFTRVAQSTKVHFHKPPPLRGSFVRYLHKAEREPDAVWSWSITLRHNAGLPTINKQIQFCISVQNLIQDKPCFQEKNPE